jgi:CRISPR-associated protein (TIGR03986 family)
MSQLKSTYNFVPATEESEVFIPSWADQVSHDVPFSDGESGEIEIEITAETPIFIREGISASEAKKKQENGVAFDFSHYLDGNEKKHYFIPATSLKGMTRNVLEIMSFSRLNDKLVNDDRYSFRDLSKSDNLYLSTYKKFKINAGWLIQDQNGNWKIEECEDLAFIDHVELKDKGFPFRDLFLDKNPVKEGKISQYKYTQAKELKLEDTFLTSEKTLFGNIKRNIAIFSTEGKKGTLVFTGQATKRQESSDPKRRNSGKFHEFVFFNSINQTYIDVSLDMQKDFKFIYYDGDRNNISKDWEFWRNEYLLKNKKVPVFYSKDEKGELQHFGLTYMYKLPYKNSVHELLPISSYPKKFLAKDLANTLFGYTDNSDSLKGRILFGNAKINSPEPETIELKEILGSPKASYFPFYLNQFKNERDKEYNTFQDKTSLKGFKRYPVHSEGFKAGDYDDKQKENQKVFSKLTALNSQTKFKFKIRYNNLKPIEIGALLSALTFHGNNNKCFHSLGGAKSFGYGKVKLEITGNKYLEKSISEYLASFEAEMEDKLTNSWWESKQLKELFAMSSNEVDDSLEYPKIQDFVNYKKAENGFKLDDYSEISNFNSKQFKSILKQSIPQANLELNQTRFAVLSVELNRLLQDELESFSDNNKEIIFQIIKFIYESHKDSRKKLSKPYDWEKNIVRWLGEEMTENLKENLGVTL